MRIIYVHGFNSYIGSTTGAKLRALDLMDTYFLIVIHSEMLRIKEMYDKGRLLCSRFQGWKVI